MIVLSESQKLFLENFLIPFRELMYSRGVDVNPIEIKGNLFILPIDLLFAEPFKEIKEALDLGGHTQNITIREVLQEELIEPTFI